MALLRNALLFCLIASICQAQGVNSIAKPQGTIRHRQVDEGSDVKVFDKAGKPFAKRTNKYQRPKAIVDTVKIVAGWGQCKLNSRFQRLQHRTAATSALAAYPVVTPLLSDTTKTVYYYAVSVKDNGKRIVIKSSGGTADTGVVVLHCYVR